MNTEEYIKFAEAFFGKSIEISKAKNADYTAQGGNAFANFEAVETVAGIPNATAIGFVTRMMDKMMRISSFVKNGQLLVKDEGVSDSLSDLANYACLFAGWLETQKPEEKDTSVVVTKFKENQRLMKEILDKQKEKRTNYETGPR